MNGKTESETQCSADKVNGSNGVEKDKKTEKEPFNLAKIFKSFLAFFTVEPYLLFYVIPSVISSLATSKLDLEKACRVDLNYTKEICLKGISGNADDNITIEAITEASILVAGISSWRDPIKQAIPAFFILFIGAWSDKTGNRKALLLIPLVGEVLSLIGLLAGTYFFLEWPLWTMGVIEALSSTFTGGLPVALMGSYSYVADVTPPEDRTFRIGVVAVIVTMGLPLGSAISGVLINAVGYYGVFSISLCFYIAGFIHTLFRIHDVRHVEIEGSFSYKLKQFFHPMNVWDTISIVFKSRGRQLVQILLVIWAHIIIMGPTVGEASVTYLYTLNRYSMDLVDYSLYITYMILVGIAGTSIAIAVFSKWLKFHDSVLGIIATTSKVLADLTYGLAPTRNWFFAGPIVDIFGNSGVTAIRSLGTKVVDQENVGKMCSLIGFIDSVIPAIYMPMYNKVLTLTLKTYPGTVYLLGAVMTVPDYIVFITLYILFKKTQRDVVKRPETKEMHVYDNDITSL